MNNESFLYGAYGLVIALHLVYAFTLRVRRRKLEEELEMLRNRAARKAQ